MADELKYVPTTAGPALVPTREISDVPSGDIYGATPSAPEANPVLDMDLPDQAPEVRALSGERSPDSTLDFELPDQNNTLKNNYDKTSDKNPDEAAEVYDISKKTGEDPGYVAENLGEIKKQMAGPRPG